MLVQYWRDFIPPSSFLRHTFFMDLSIGDRVFYTRSNGVQVPATVVGTVEDGLIHLEYYQDALRVVNRQCKMESISFAIPSSSSLPHCPTSPPSAPQEAPSQKDSCVLLRMAINALFIAFLVVHDPCYVKGR